MYNNDLNYSPEDLNTVIETLVYYDIGGVDIYAQDKLAFKNACEASIINVVRWLYSLGGFTVKDQKQNALFPLTLHDLTG
jgi:hypothetical protein